MRPRLYAPRDLRACLAIFDSNVPDYFSSDEHAEFNDFLTNYDLRAGPYLVLEADNEVVACGGVLANPEHKAGSLVWGMVHRAWHRQGLGTQLTEVRLDLARSMPNIRELLIETSQHTSGFYEAFGFVVKSVTTDGFGPNLDRVEMTLQFS